MKYGVLGIATGVVAGAIVFNSACAADGITLSAPWAYGETWEVGGSGSYYREDWHSGKNTYAIDINRRDSNCNSAEDDGQPVLAAHDGTVTLADHLPGGYGWTVEIRSKQDSRYVSRYSHLKYDPKQDTGISVGYEVARGERIGSVGMTGGTSSGPHLHFVLYKDGMSVPPSPLSGYVLPDTEPPLPQKICVKSDNATPYAVSGNLAWAPLGASCQEAHRWYLITVNGGKKVKVLLADKSTAQQSINAVGICDSHGVYGQCSYTGE